MSVFEMFSLLKKDLLYIVKVGRIVISLPD